jgi:uncharacterized membrane protein
MRRKWPALVLFAALTGALFGVGLPTASAAPATTTVHAVSVGMSTPVDATVPDQHSAAQQIYFHNYYESTVWVSLGYRDQAHCRYNGGWATQGWWPVPFGQSVRLLTTSDQAFEFYAYSEDGQRVWDGTGATPGHTILVNRSAAFFSCLTTPHPGWDSVVTRYVYTGNQPSYTYDLFG